MPGILSKVIGNTIIDELAEQLDDKTHIYALDKLNNYKINGIQIGDYEDDVWTISNGQVLVNLKFNKDKRLIKICTQNSIVPKSFINHLKDYIILTFGKYEPRRVRQALYYIIKNTILSDMGNIRVAPNDATMLRDYVDFISMVSYYPLEYINYCKNVLRGYKAQETARRRLCGTTAQPIPEFQSFFKFIDLIMKIPESIKDEKMLLYMYPLYLYWKITTIIPCRVTEFCITPLNCTKINKGHYFIRLRKSKKKGFQGDLKSVTTYILENDYKLHQFEITKSVYEEIQWYIEKTYIYRQTKASKKLLFSPELHDQFKPFIGGQKVNMDLAFSSEMLNKIMSDFYFCEVSKHYKIISKNNLLIEIAESGVSEIKDNEIVKLNNNQTRHLAIMNIILRGANPVVARDFAGHASLEVTENYYNHISDFVRVGTHYYYNLSKKNKDTRKEQNPLLIYGQSYQTKLKDGICFSENYSKGSCQDCKRSNGICQNCGFFSGQSSNEENLKAEMLAFTELLYSKDIEANIEEFNRRTLKLQHEVKKAADQYIRELIEKEN